MKLRNGLMAVALALVITGGSAAAANAAEPAPATAVSGNPVDITTPSSEKKADDRYPEFRGTGTPGASVVVKDLRGTVLCTARVTADGWSCSSAVPMGDGLTGVVATQDAWGAKTSDSATFIVKHAAQPAVPLWVFAVGGAVVLLLVAAASALLVARNRRNGTVRTSSEEDGEVAEGVAPEEQPTVA